MADAGPGMPAGRRSSAGAAAAGRPAWGWTSPAAPPRPAAASLRIDSSAAGTAVTLELGPAWRLLAMYRGVYLGCIVCLHERSSDPARPPRTGAEPRLRPQARLRRVLRPRASPLPFGQLYATLGRLARDGKVVRGRGRARCRARPQALRHHRRGRDRVRGLARRAGRARAAPADGAVRQGRARPDARSGTRSGYLDTQRAAHLQRMRELTEVKRTGGLVDALLADHGLFHLEADLRWIDLTAARLDALAKEVRS